jgi:hypothetical protein
VLAAKDERGAQPLVGVGGRHPDIYDRHIGAMLGNLVQERVAVGHGGQDLVPAILEKTNEPFSHDGGIFSDHDAHRTHPQA